MQLDIPAMGVLAVCEKCFEEMTEGYPFLA